MEERLVSIITPLIACCVRSEGLGSPQQHLQSPHACSPVDARQYGSRLCRSEVSASAVRDSGHLLVRLTAGSDRFATSDSLENWAFANFAERHADYHSP